MTTSITTITTTIIITTIPMTEASEIAQCHM